MELIILLQWGNALLVSSGIFQKLEEFLTFHVTRGLVTIPVQAKHTFKVGFMAVFNIPSNLVSERKIFFSQLDISCSPIGFIELVSLMD